jgi:hypothetical protein
VQKDHHRSLSHPVNALQQATLGFWFMPPVCRRPELPACSLLKLAVQ